MVGFTLSPEQIRQAPPDVRRWLEQQIAGALGLGRPEPELRMPQRHLVACTVEEARGILSLLQGMLPAVGVLFELGREPAAASAQGLRALRLDEMLRHSRLQTPGQLISALEAIDEALQRVRGEPGVALTALDGAGHCLVAETTARSIMTLWQEIVAAHGAARGDAMPTPMPMPAGPRPAPAAFQAPYTLSVAPYEMAPGTAPERMERDPEA